MSKPPSFCERCGCEPTHKQHYPLVKVKGHGWLCSRCTGDDERSRKESAKNN